MVELIIAACVLGVLAVGLALIPRVCKPLSDEVGSVPDNCP